MIFGIRKSKKIWNSGTSKVIADKTADEKKPLISKNKKRRTRGIECPNCGGGE